MVKLLINKNVDTYQMKLTIGHQIWQPYALLFMVNEDEMVANTELHPTNQLTVKRNFYFH